jgi:antirestriction protein ArdC
MVTERIVTKIQDAINAIERGEKGLAPWNRPWHQSGIPSNLISKKPYRGINVFLLAAMGHPSPYFLTFNQAKAIGGQVKKGEHGYPVVFWKWLDVNEDENGNKLPQIKKIPFLRYYTVFNVSQIDGIDDKIPTVATRQFNPIQDAEKIIANMPNAPKIENGAKACYVPSLDIVKMPSKELFQSEQDYYSVAFHELVHSTGHEKRLNRTEVMDSKSFGSHNYSREELVAEMGAIFLCNEIGLDNVFDNSLAYLKSWLGTFKNDVKMLVVASGRAQKATDYILNTKHEAKSEE